MKCTVRQLFAAFLVVLSGSLSYAQSTLISTGAVWKYLDDGSNQGAEWRALGFNDAPWPSGPAPLGYGDGDEATTNSFGADPLNKFITTYYRHAFSVGNASEITNLVLRVLRDDAAVAYLNGVEVFRSNLPTGEVLYTTLALDRIEAAEEVQWLSARVNPVVLIAGSNHLAAEIHQVDTTSSDISFDLELVANTPMLPTLVPLGSVWRYRADGAAPDPQWRDLAFDDLAWTEGHAQLGYGDGDEATHIESGPATNVFITSYFRHTFEVADPAAVSQLVLRVLRDDGAIAYLNGAEVFRNNMPTGMVDHTTWAVEVISVPQESQFYATRVDPALLRAGRNVLAVEVHQGNNTSSDVSFDLELLFGIAPAAPVVAITQPLDGATLTAPATFTMAASATDFDGVITDVKFLFDNIEVAADAKEPYGATCSNRLAGAHVIHAVATDDSGLSATSAPVMLRIDAPPVIVNLITNNSWWRVFDTGTEPPGAWFGHSYADGGWRLGPGQFGWGEADEGTVLQPAIDSPRAC
ncbi:MAG: Ig-like domain-containing protein, partial [Phycisphaerales bacterium]|nr:Ig-like domain-containing protein [Phycisphaerales bacterium]